MKDYNEEYFFIDSDGKSNHPNLDLSEDQDDLSLFRNELITEDEFPFELILSDPIPKKPQMVDYHSYATRHVFSKRIKEVIESLNLKNVQFIPTEIIGKKGEIFDNYFIMHLFNEINCINKTESKFTTLTRGYISTFDKLVLDNEIINKVPLENRLAFKIGEQSIYTVFHISVIEKLLKKIQTLVYQLSRL